MKQRELARLFMTILNWKNILVSRFVYNILAFKDVMHISGRAELQLLNWGLYFSSGQNPDIIIFTIHAPRKHLLSARNGAQ